jgi:hypothetical protein
MLPALNQQLQISTHRFCQIGAAFSIISSKYFACGEKMPKFDVWIVDEGKKLGDKLPGPLFIEDVDDMYVGKFIQAVMYQEWKPDVYKWAQRDASVTRLKTMTGGVYRKLQLSSYADPPGIPCPLHWGRLYLQLILVLLRGHWHLRLRRQVSCREACPTLYCQSRMPKIVQNRLSEYDEYVCCKSLTCMCYHLIDSACLAAGFQDIDKPAVRVKHWISGVRKQVDVAETLDELMNDVHTTFHLDNSSLTMRLYYIENEDPTDARTRVTDENFFSLLKCAFRENGGLYLFPEDKCPVVKPAPTTRTAHHHS